MLPRKGKLIFPAAEQCLAKALALPWGEATAVDTALGVAHMLLLCCSNQRLNMR